jgi:hypothetical protein
MFFTQSRATQSTLFFLLIEMRGGSHKLSSMR